MRNLIIVMCIDFNRPRDFFFIIILIMCCGDLRYHSAR
jgi:hypothetical protein